jgi:hypothetical protein
MISGHVYLRHGRISTAEPTIAEKLIEFAYTSELAITQVRRQFQSEEELTSGFIKL